MASKFQAIKGTKDILPDETPRWRRIEDIVHRTMRAYRYREIRTPVFERTELFIRSIGEGTDIVNKEMYTFQDKGGRSLTLKPEGTASVIRAYAQHNLGQDARLAKMYYLFPLFRQENPQEGRLREHHQFGVETVGSDDPHLDAEVIELLLEVYRRCGLRDMALHLNTIGCGECRPAYVTRLKEHLAGVRDELCEDCRKRYDGNTLRILDCKRNRCRELTDNAPAIHETVCEACGVHFSALRECLNAAGIAYLVDKRLVRGLDYYTRTTFEVKCEGLGAQNTIGGGGRYNGMVRELGGADMPAIGFGSGIERLLLALDRQDVPDADDGGCDVYFAVFDAEGRRKALELAKPLRDAELGCEINFIDRSMKAQLREANRMGARYALILGGDELGRGGATVKDMGADGGQEFRPFGDLVPALFGR